MFLIVASLTEDSRRIIYDCNMFIVQATVVKYFTTVITLLSLPKVLFSDMYQIPWETEIEINKSEFFLSLYIFIINSSE